MSSQPSLPDVAASHTDRTGEGEAGDGLARGALVRGDVDALAPDVAASPLDVAAVSSAVEALLRALGQDPTTEALHDTPRRVAASFAEMLTPRPFDATTFANDEQYDELVVAKDIPFTSLCEHHLLPFVGRAAVGYFPRDRILGLSKLARVVEMFSRRLQVQERLTKQVAQWLHDELDPHGVGVVLEAEHMCMSVRGVRAPGVSTVTSALLGSLREDARSRHEFLSLVRG